MGGPALPLPAHLPNPESRQEEILTVQHIEYAARDSQGRLTFYVLLWKRRGITQQQFDDYWRDVHGPVCARLPGQCQYWQWHVHHNVGGIFPAIAGVEH